MGLGARFEPQLSSLVAPCRGCLGFRHRSSTAINRRPSILWVPFGGRYHGNLPVDPIDETLPTDMALDGWGTPFRYEVWGTADSPLSEYDITSAGADRMFEHSRARDYPQRAFLCEYDPDIVFSTGSFIQYPEAAEPPGGGS